MEIKEVFSSKEELNDCLKWWQEKLFLTDWIIKSKVCDWEDFKSKEKCAGENYFISVNRCSQIFILKKEEYEKENPIMKYCAEKILVHELLHLKFDLKEADQETNEIHALIEQMAKSLIMEKYNLSLDYFNDAEVD